MESVICIQLIIIVLVNGNIFSNNLYKGDLYLTKIVKAMMTNNFTNSIIDHLKTLIFHLNHLNVLLDQAINYVFPKLQLELRELNEKRILYLIIELLIVLIIKPKNKLEFSFLIIYNR